MLDEEIQYEVLPEGNFVTMNSKMRQGAGMLGKSFGRFIIETEYFDYEVLSPENTGNSANELFPLEKDEAIPKSTIKFTNR